MDVASAEMDRERVSNYSTKFLQYMKQQRADWVVGDTMVLLLLFSTVENESGLSPFQCEGKLV